MKSPLQLERYVFTKLEVEANASYAPQQQAEGSPENPTKLRLDLGFGGHKEDPTKFQVEVGVDELRLERGELPYRIALRVVGQFSVDKNFKPSNLHRLVQVNGASMLYSAARELVLIVTGRGPWPAYQLPALSFHQAVTDLEPGEQKTHHSEAL